MPLTDRPQPGVDANVLMTQTLVLVLMGLFFLMWATDGWHGDIGLIRTHMATRIFVGGMIGTVLGAACVAIQDPRAERRRLLTGLWMGGSAMVVTQSLAWTLHPPLTDIIPMAMIIAVLTLLTFKTLAKGKRNLMAAFLSVLMAAHLLFSILFWAVADRPAQNLLTQTTNRHIAFVQTLPEGSDRDRVCHVLGLDCDNTTVAPAQNMDFLNTRARQQAETVATTFWAMGGLWLLFFHLKRLERRRQRAQEAPET